MSLATDVGLRIKRLRMQRRWKQADLAERIGVARASVASWEIGRRIPEPELLPELSRLLGVTLDYLFCGEPIDRGPKALAKDLWDTVREFLLDDSASMESNLHDLLVLLGAPFAPELLKTLASSKVTDDDVRAVRELLEKRQQERNQKVEEPPGQS